MLAKLDITPELEKLDKAFQHLEQLWKVPNSSWDVASLVEKRAAVGEILAAVRELVKAAYANLANWAEVSEFVEEKKKVYPNEEIQLCLDILKSFAEILVE